LATAPELADERDLRVRVRERVLARLRSQRDRGGLLRERVVRETAAELGCSPRTVRRWLAAGPDVDRQPARVIDDELYGAYVGWHGNVAAVRRELVGKGRELPSLRTLQRAFVRELRPIERAAAKTGELGIRSHGLYVCWEAEHRNEVWQGDHKQLDVLVVPPRARRPLRPWSTIFMDAFSRAIIG
jgi:putative transposase